MFSDEEFCILTLSNIQSFDEITGKVFAALYEAFPVPRILMPAQFMEGGEDAVFVPDSFTGAELTLEAEFFMASIDWLVNEGYINSSRRDPQYFGDVVLSSKGLAALSAVPDSLTSPKPLGERLVAAAKSGGKEILQSTLREVLSVGLKTIMPS